MQRISITGQLHVISSRIEVIERMIEKDADPINVIREIQVIQAALKNINLQLLEDHISCSVLIDIETTDLIERQKILKEIACMLITLTKCGQSKPNHLRRSTIRVR